MNQKAVTGQPFHPPDGGCGESTEALSLAPHDKIAHGFEA
jgi:hypothetical protein